MPHDVLDIEDASEIIVSCMTEATTDIDILNDLGRQLPRFLMSVSDYSSHQIVIQERPDIVLYRARIVDAFEDFELIRRLRESLDYVPILVILEYQDIDLICEYLRSGVSAFCSQIDHHRHLGLHLAALSHLTKMSRILEIENRHLKAQNTKGPL